MQQSLKLPGSTGGMRVFGNPRTFPILVSSIIILISSIHLMTEVVKARKAQKSPVGTDESAEEGAESSSVLKKGWIRIVLLILVIVAYILLLDVITYLPASILTLAAVFLIFGNKNMKVVVPLTVLLPLFLFLVFRYVLKVPLP